MDDRKRKIKLNIFVSLLSHIISIFCGLIVTRMLLNKFGSEIYGATTSIIKFLSYIILIEGGIGGVARSVLYKPLATNNKIEISKIVNSIRRYFSIVGTIFLLYTICLALSFKYISSIQALDYLQTFLLVLVISISTFAEYYIGISYSVLLQADQKTYVTTSASVITTIINAIIVVILVNINCSIVIVKFASSVVYIIKPVILCLYVKKNNYLIDTKETKELPNKLTGLGQHIAYFVHNNVDVIILTIFVSLKDVSVYSVYMLIINNIQNIAVSFSAGMEAVFGDMYAKNEKNELVETFHKYEDLMFLISIVLLGTTSASIMPFISLYTKNINDINYIQPIFACFMIVSSFIYLVRLPYHNLVIAIGHFKQTRIAAYGEVIINILISLLSIKCFGLVGIAFGTFAGTLFRYIWYVIYISKNIFEINLYSFIKTKIINFCIFFIIIIISFYFSKIIVINNYFKWIIYSGLSFIIISMIYISLFLIIYKKDINYILKIILSRRRKHIN